MRFIEELRDKYKGKEIWVLGTGPSLDDFPLEFFNDKIFIAMRPNDIIFPNFTFSICTYDQPQYCLQFRTNPARLKRQIFTLNPKHKANWLGEYNKYPIFFRTFKPYSFRDSPMWPGVGRYVRRVHVEKTVKEIMMKNSFQYAGIGIMQGWTIEAALVLGATRIILVGCEGRITKYNWHAKKLGFVYDSPEHPRKFKAGSDGFTKKQRKFFERWCQRTRTEVQWFIEILKPYGIEILRYFYKTGYEKIIP